jgi:predicted nucleic acid-binding protein
VAHVIVVDASCLYEVVVNTPRAEQVRMRMLADPDHAAPHIVDIEVFSIIRRQELGRALDATRATLAIDRLHNWPGERFPHRALLLRAWELRHTVRGWDAAYVALAEALDATLVTFDERLVRATGPRCPIELP